MRRNVRPTVTFRMRGGKAVTFDAEDLRKGLLNNLHVRGALLDGGANEREVNARFGKGTKFGVNEMTKMSACWATYRNDVGYIEDNDDDEEKGEEEDGKEKGQEEEEWHTSMRAQEEANEFCDIVNERANEDGDWDF